MSIKLYQELKNPSLEINVIMCSTSNYQTLTNSYTTKLSLNQKRTCSLSLFIISCVIYFINVDCMRRVKGTNAG